jgi:hypothetical protein
MDPGRRAILHWEVTAIELAWINNTPPTWRASCRCFGTRPRTQGLPLEVLLGRTVLLTIARWFVLLTIDNFLQVRAAWRGVIPYFLVWIFLRCLTREFSDMRNAREWGKWQMNDLSFDGVPPRPYIIDHGALHAHMMTTYP